jgi:nucleotide-binding universal stress UspA family protein
MSFRKILVTLDGSDLAELALKHVMSVASRETTIYLLSVVGSVLVEDRVNSTVASVSTMNIPYFVMPKAQPQVMHHVGDPRIYRDRVGYLERVGDDLRAKGYRVHVDVRPGKVVDTIIATAKEGFDLLIMATHGRTGLSRVALGSVAEAVIRRVPCPTLLVPAGGRRI